MHIYGFHFISFFILYKYWTSHAIIDFFMSTTGCYKCKEKFVLRGEAPKDLQ